MMPPFASHRSFLDPVLSSSGKPFAIEGMNDLVRDCYLVSKHCHTSYADVLELTPRERYMLLTLIAEDIQKKNEVEQRFIDNFNRRK